jgi:hypothetical protein
MLLIESEREIVLYCRARIMKMDVTSIVRAAVVAALCAGLSAPSLAESVDRSAVANRTGLAPMAATVGHATFDLSEIVVAVKVFKVFGDDDNGGDGSSAKSGSRARSRSRAAQKRQRNTRKVPSVLPAPDTYPSGILQLIDPSACDGLKM